MLEIKPRSLRRALLLAGLCVLLAGCNPKPKQKPPGDDDDRPIVMDGSSFKVSWKEVAGASDNGFDLEGEYKHSQNATANWLECELGSSFQVLRKDKKPLVVSVLLEATHYPVLQAKTKKNGKQLDIVVIGDYKKNSDPLAEHPDGQAKILSVSLDNVALTAGTKLPPNCTETVSGISCNTSKVSAPRVTIHVCRGTSCKDPAP